MSMDARLMLALHIATNIHPAMHAIDLAVEGLATGIHRLDMTAPAVDELMRTGGDPVVVAHASNIRLSSWNRPADTPVCSAVQQLF